MFKCTAHDGLVISPEGETPVNGPDDPRFRYDTEFYVEVDPGYRPDRCLTPFLKRYKRGCEGRLFFGDDRFTDSNFCDSGTSKILYAGLQLRVEVIELLESVPGVFCIDYLRMCDALLVGAHGLVSVYEQARHKLPFGRRSASFADPEDLLSEGRGKYYVPHITKGGETNTGYSVGFGRLDGLWGTGSRILAFFPA